MDSVSQIRFKNVLDRLLIFCEEAESEEDKAVLLRIGVVALNKLRIHADVDSMLGQDIRDLNVQISSCIDREQLTTFMWDETLGLLQAYREALD